MVKKASYLVSGSMISVTNLHLRVAVFSKMIKSSKWATLDAVSGLSTVCRLLSIKLQKCSEFIRLSRPDQALYQEK